jgi:hypothetical protein
LLARPVGAPIKEFVTGCCHHLTIADESRFAAMELLKWFERGQDQGLVVSFKRECPEYGLPG